MTDDAATILGWWVERWRHCAYHAIVMLSDVPGVPSLTVAHLRELHAEVTRLRRLERELKRAWKMFPDPLPGSPEPGKPEGDA